VLGGGGAHPLLRSPARVLGGLAHPLLGLGPRARDPLLGLALDLLDLRDPPLGLLADALLLLALLPGGLLALTLVEPPQRLPLGGLADRALRRRPLGGGRGLLDAGRRGCGDFARRRGGGRPARAAALAALALALALCLLALGRARLPPRLPLGAPAPEARGAGRLRALPPRPPELLPAPRALLPREPSLRLAALALHGGAPAALLPPSPPSLGARLALGRLALGRLLGPARRLRTRRRNGAGRRRRAGLRRRRGWRAGRRRRPILHGRRPLGRRRRALLALAPEREAHGLILARGAVREPCRSGRLNGWLQRRSRSSRSISRRTSRSRSSRRRSRCSLPRASASSTFARGPLK